MEFKNNINNYKITLKKVINSYKVRQISLWILDMCGVLISILVAIILTLNYQNTDINIVIPLLIIYMIIHTISFNIFKCYCSLWRYAGEEEMVSILLACVVYVIPVYIVHKLIGVKYSILFYIVATILIIGCTGGLRLVYRTGRRLKTRLSVSNNSNRVLVVGAGSAGQMIINELKENPQLNKVAVGIIDDDINKIGRRIHNIKILGDTSQIKEIVEKEKIDEIILAIASIDKIKKSQIIEKCRQTKCKLKTIPGIYEIIDGKVDIKKIRDVDIEDLLGREPIKVNMKEMSDYIKERTVLVTGGGGSIGSELCRQIASFNPKHLIIVDNYENNAYAI